jgi:hypothetical protein
VIALESGVEAKYLSARLSRLDRLGISGSLAVAAAEERNLGISEIEDLVAAGCHPVTALRICWPLEESFESQGWQDQGDQSLPDLVK